MNNNAESLKNTESKLGKLLRSDRSKEVFTFLLFLLLSFIFWALQSLDEDVDGTFTVNVKYVNVPERVVFTSDLPDKIDIRLRDKGTVLMGYLMNRIPAIEIDFRRYENKNGVFVITQAQLSSLLHKSLKNTTGLLAVTPDSIPVYYTDNAGKKYRVRLRGSFSSEPQCVIYGEIEMSSDSVMVYAPSSVLKNIKEIVTDSLVLTALSDTVRVSLNLSGIQGAKIVPDKVEVMVPVEEITTKTLSLPVVPQNLPVGISMLTFPASVQVSCMIPVSQFSKIQAEDFAVGVDYEQLQDDLGKKIEVQVLNKPLFVNNISVNPDSVEYILEEKVGLW
ncbi:MAG: YbbR-like domain-containing protein [Coprobacter sp.]|nr:YbbR-like domain-containing protein [Coprobacter sp.]